MYTENSSAYVDRFWHLGNIGTGLKHRRIVIEILNIDTNYSLSFHLAVTSCDHEVVHRSSFMIKYDLAGEGSSHWIVCEPLIVCERVCDIIKVCIAGSDSGNECVDRLVLSNGDAE